PFGGAIALALDLTLRDRTDGRTSLDDYMRAMWRVHGKPGGARPGYVDHPYTIADAAARLAEASGDRALARDFFARDIQGHGVDCARRRSAPGRRRDRVGRWNAHAGAESVPRELARIKTLTGRTVVSVKRRERSKEGGGSDRVRLAQRT